jgi:hypothetical protein
VGFYLLISAHFLLPDVAKLTHGLSVGQLNDQPALRALFACESGLSEPEIGWSTRSFF